MVTRRFRRHPSSSEAVYCVVLGFYVDMYTIYIHIVLATAAVGSISKELESSSSLELGERGAQASGSCHH